MHGTSTTCPWPRCTACRACCGGTQKSRLLTGAAAGTLGYRLLTRYELGLGKVLPMPVHLGLDSLNAVVQGAVAFLFLHEETLSQPRPWHWPCPSWPWSR